MNRPLLTGFGRMIITPPHGYPIGGYYNLRYRETVLDELHAKVFLVKDGDTVGGVISFDLVAVSSCLYEGVCRSLEKAGLKFGRNLIICATHTHTGPECRSWRLPPAWQKPSQDYLDFVLRQTVEAVRMALANLCPSTLYCGSHLNNPFAFNRRYIMKDGMVVTNPGKLNPDVVRPEGTVDREIGVLMVRQKGGIAGLVVNLCNHGDTIGGSRISADWPGFMERQLQRLVGYQVPVLTLDGASGNINHFDLSSEDSQTSYAEAKRIGNGYGRMVHQMLPALSEMRAGRFSVKRWSFPFEKRTISQKEIEKARRVLRKYSKAQDGKDLTSEDLARGHATVLLLSAQRLLEFAEKENGLVVHFPLVGLRFGTELGIVSLPGEPFTEIGLGIKRGSPCKKTFVATLANGSCGYIPNRECFGRGGYETLPGMHAGASEKVAGQMIESAIKILQR